MEFWTYGQRSGAYFNKLDLLFLEIGQVYEHVVVCWFWGLLAGFGVSQQGASASDPQKKQKMSYKNPQHSSKA